MSVHDSAIDRFSARARFAAALSLIALIDGAMFAGSLTAPDASTHRGVEQLETAQRPVTGS
jgi:hypothetical protein